MERNKGNLEEVEKEITNLLALELVSSFSEKEIRELVGKTVKIESIFVNLINKKNQSV